jgi:hypothetical protein
MAEPLAGTLHAFVAFDWGDEVDLERAQLLVPAERPALPRRRRTPPSIGYRPAPLRFFLPTPTLQLESLGAVQPAAEATLFDFAGVSMALRIPVDLSADALTRLAGWLADPTPVVEAARALLQPLYRTLRPAIENPQWQDELSEEYFVFQFPPRSPDQTGQLSNSPPLGPPSWLAGLLRLEAGLLSTQEVTEALRLKLSYSPTDLFISDWGVALIFDRDCEETLQTIEFTNLQLLEYRHIDRRLDTSVASAWRLLHPLTQTRLPLWRIRGRPLRVLGELKVEATELFERTRNVFKLVGDQYLARVYDLLAERFHLQEWEASIQQKLSVLQGVYEVLSDQAATYRGEIMEVVVILLIALEIVLAVLRH